MRVGGRGRAGGLNTSSFVSCWQDGPGRAGWFDQENSFVERRLDF